MFFDYWHYNTFLKIRILRLRNVCGGGSSLNMVGVGHINPDHMTPAEWQSQRTELSLA